MDFYYYNSDSLMLPRLFRLKLVVANTIGSTSSTEVTKHVAYSSSRQP